MAMISPSAEYVEVQGNGHDLPHGCIWDNVGSHQTVIYWNPHGSVTSEDFNVRQICQHGEDACQGTKFLNNKIYILKS